MNEILKYCKYIEKGFRQEMDYKFKIGDKVKFNFKGKELQGEITDYDVPWYKIKVDNETTVYRILIEGSKCNIQLIEYKNEYEYESTIQAQPMRQMFGEEETLNPGEVVYYFDYDHNDSRLDFVFNKSEIESVCKIREDSGNTSRNYVEYKLKGADKNVYFQRDELYSTIDESYSGKRGLTGNSNTDSTLAAAFIECCGMEGKVVWTDDFICSTVKPRPSGRGYKVDM